MKRTGDAMDTENPPPDRSINYIEFNVADIPRSKDFYGISGTYFGDVFRGHIT